MNKYFQSIFISILTITICLPNICAQAETIGKLNTWTVNKVASRTKFDEILPIKYQLRVSKNSGFDRLVFEFREKEVPEYTVFYTNPPITLEPSHLENPKKPNPDEIIKVRGQAFVMIVFALGFDGKETTAQFSGQKNLPMVQDLQTVDWFENFISMAVGLKIKKPFRVLELSHPTRLVIDFKH